jgi:hypothetical protein
MVGGRLSEDPIAERFFSGGANGSGTEIALLSGVSLDRGTSPSVVLLFGPFRALVVDDLLEQQP